MIMKKDFIRDSTNIKMIRNDHKKPCANKFNTIDKS